MNAVQPSVTLLEQAPTPPQAPSPTPTTQPTTPVTPAAEGAPSTPSLINEPTETDPTAPPATESPAAPATYADFTAPEGVTLDPKAIEAITPVLRELNLSQEQAQKLVSIQAEREAGLTRSMTEASRAEYERVRGGWRDEVSREFGTRLPEVRTEIGRALNLIPESIRADFRTAMDMTGVGDNPAFVRAFYAFSKLVNDGRPVNGSPATPSQTPRTSAQAIWGDEPKGAPQSGRTA